jgi:hypothetical protein
MMTAKMTTLIEQFSLVEGIWRNAPHNQAAVREPQKGKLGKGTLLIVVEVRGQLSKLEVVEKQLVAMIRDNYYLSQGGITASLRRTVQMANQWLYRQNQAIDEERQVVGGLVAAVIRDEDLFVAQLGPAALFTAMGQMVQRYPETAVWLDQPHAEAETAIDSALGLHHYAAPNISHLKIQPGDLFVLTDGRLARHLSTSAISRVLKEQQVEVISQNLARATQARHGSAMVIQMIAADSVKQPAPKVRQQVPAGPEQPGGFQFALPNILHRVTGSRPTQTSPDQIEPRAAEAEIDFEQDDATWSEGPKSGRGSSPAQIARKGIAAILGGIAFLGSGLHTILKLVLPGSQVDSKMSSDGGAKARAVAGKQPSYKALIYIAFGLPVLALLITLIMVWYRGYNQENTYMSIVSEAQEKFSAAQSAPPDTAINLLTEAEQQLTQAGTIKEGQAEVETLKTNITTQRDEIGKVERLYYVPELRRYTDPGTQLSRVIVQGDNIYVLDTGLDRLFHHRLDNLGDTLLPDEGNPMLLQRGQHLGEATVGDIIDMVWMPAGSGRQTSDLLILTREGLLEFNPDWGAGPIPISGIQLWQWPVAASSYFGNFYLLDRQANLIHRYRPDVGGYEGPSESYFPDGTFVDLSEAVDMTIDGYVYVLYQNGEIKKFLGGEPAPFQISGLDIPFNGPTAIYTAPDEEVQYLYVADAGNQRIVQLGKEGEFIRQFKPREEDGVAFDDLQSIYVDEISEKMFVLNGGSLYAPNIPVK